MVCINFTDAVCWLLLTGWLLDGIYLFKRSRKREWMERRKSRKRAGNHIPAASMCDTPHSPCTLPEQLASLLAKEALPKPPFVFLAFPSFLVGHIKTVYGLSVVTQCSNFLLFTSSPPLLPSALTVFLFCHHITGAAKLDVWSQSSNHATGPLSLGQLEEQHSCFAQESYRKFGL